MHLAQVLVEEFDIPSRDVERRRTVAEDALEREHVTAVGEKGSREGMPQDMRGAAHLEIGPLRCTTHDLLDAPARQRLTLLRRE